MQPLVLACLLRLAGGADPGGPHCTLPENLGKTARKYGIDILTTDPNFPVKFRNRYEIDGKPADGRDVARLAETFVREFSLYPRELVTGAGLRRVVLCKDLKLDGVMRGGGLTDWEHDTIYFDVSTYNGGEGSYLSRAIHHEIMHIVDYANGRKTPDDERWSALNPADFEYGPGGAAALDDPSAPVLTDRYPGFFNRYATMSVAEDKAEVFAILVTAPEYVRRRTEADSVLKAKVNRVKELVAGVCPQMGDAFWDRTVKVIRPPVEFRTAAKVDKIRTIPKVPLTNSIPYVGP